MLKVVILAMCFETDITFVISELKAKASLREFTGVHDVPDAKEVYRLLSRFTVFWKFSFQYQIPNFITFS